jgi:hypothetical protein
MHRTQLAKKSARRSKRGACPSSSANLAEILKVRRRGGNSRQDGVAALLTSARTVSWATSQSNHPKTCLHKRQQRQQKRCDSNAR